MPSTVSLVGTRPSAAVYRPEDGTVTVSHAMPASACRSSVLENTLPSVLLNSSDHVVSE